VFLCMKSIIHKNQKQKTCFLKYPSYNLFYILKSYQTTNVLIHVSHYIVTENHLNIIHNRLNWNIQTKTSLSTTYSKLNAYQIAISHGLSVIL
jgi:hypothetical protein